MDASTVSAYFLTSNIELVRFLVPKYLKPNEVMAIGPSPCAIVKLFGHFKEDQDGCEWALGPLWLHFVIVGNHRIVEYMIEHGANLTGSSSVWDSNSKERLFTAMDVAVRRKDKPMIELLRRAGATERLYR